MKIKPQCQAKGCYNAASFHPVIVFKLNNGAEQPIIIGLLVCKGCKKKVTKPTDVLADGGDGIIGAMLSKVPGLMVTSKFLRWTTLDSHESKVFRRAQEEKSRSAS